MAVQTQEPPGGWFEGKAHVFPVRVYYEDTDLSGFVYHASYLRFMERGRSEFLRLAGAGHAGMMDAPEPLVWVVRRMNIGFLRPARIEQALTVRTSVLELGGARMSLNQSVVRGSDPLVEAEVEVCVVTLDGHPRRVPNSTRKKLEFFLESS